MVALVGDVDDKGQFAAGLEPAFCAERVAHGDAIAGPLLGQ